MPLVTLRYWAAARDAAGTAQERVTAGTLAEALAEALAAARRRAKSAVPGGRDGGHVHGGGQGPELGAVLARSSFLIDGTPVGVRAPEAVPLSDANVIEVLPPFAGG